jgi:release factor glutamine methyltransferase
MPHHQQCPPAVLRLTEAELTVRLRAAGCVFAEDEARLLAGSGATDEALAAMLDRRVAGFPLEHILGWVDFCGLRLEVGPGVFVPRQGSAFLVVCAADLTTAGATVLDLCCGCGALGVALADVVQDLRLHASDISGAAVGLARNNLAGLQAELYEGDLFDPLPLSLKGTVDTLLCNTPYVPSARVQTLPPEARLHEPLISLDGGEDGLEVQRRVAREAPDWLVPGGHILFEVGEDQEQECLRLLRDGGFDAWSRSLGDEGPTVVIGRRPA